MMDPSQHQPTDLDAMRANTLSPDQAISIGENISSRITNNLAGMRKTSERAILKIGKLLQQIVTTVTANNANVQTAIEGVIGGDDQAASNHETITDTLHGQADLVSGFVRETSAFFEQQNKFVVSASDACDEISSCANSVSKLMGKSHLLALNMQIESVRLGSEGKSFCVIAEEMKNFASEVRLANENIKIALESLNQVVPQIKQQTMDMSDRVADFSQRQQDQLAEVEAKAEAIGFSLEATIQRSELTNHEILKCSHETLSELQFQDPMSQSLQHAEHDVGKLRKLISCIKFDDIPIADIDPSVGEDGSKEQPTGEVYLF